MTLVELGELLELADDEENICCYVENDKLFASFTTRAKENTIVEVLTPYERRLLDKGQFSNEDITRKFYELKQISDFKIE